MLGHFIDVLAFDIESAFGGKFHDFTPCGVSGIVVFRGQAVFDRLAKDFGGMESGVLPGAIPKGNTGTTVSVVKGLCGEHDLLYYPRVVKEAL